MDNWGICMKLGRQTYKLNNKIYIRQVANFAGSYEAKGAFSEFFDIVLEDDICGCKSHELCEIRMQKEVIKLLLDKENLKESDIDVIIGGDIINQIIATSFSAKEYDIPFLGLYDACATFGEALSIASLMIDCQFDRTICISSSHYATAERLYRYPLELGTQLGPNSQWTVTGCGGLILEKNLQNKPFITHVTIGRIVDMGCNDANNMGGAMAPAACDTIITHLKETNRNPEYYDMILTGDLGRFGRDTLDYLCKQAGYDCSNKLNDCGSLIYSRKQKAGQGGSGAGCCSLVFCSYIYKIMLEKQIKKLLFVPTGALLSKDSAMQKQPIPCIAHAICIEID